VLVPSPLTGPAVWTPVAARLVSRGYQVTVPRLTSPGESATPYWARHAAEVAQHVPSTGVVVLVAWSGAGVLLPAVAERVRCPVACYILVDALIPEHGQSRLDHFDPAEAQQFRQAARTGWIPAWTDADLADSIPDPHWRRRVAAELAPIPLAVYEEAIPAPASWPNAPVAYLRFTATYEREHRRANAAGWRTEHRPGNHFHMLVDPDAVTADLLTLAADGAGERL
jgi:hypothetical protein